MNYHYIICGEAALLDGGELTEPVLYWTGGRWSPDFNQRRLFPDHGAAMDALLGGDVDVDSAPGYAFDPDSNELCCALEPDVDVTRFMRASNSPVLAFQIDPVGASPNELPVCMFHVGSQSWGFKLLLGEDGTFQPVLAEFDQAGDMTRVVDLSPISTT